MDTIMCVNPYEHLHPNMKYENFFWKIFSNEDKDDIYNELKITNVILNSKYKDLSLYSILSDTKDIKIIGPKTLDFFKLSKPYVYETIDYFMYQNKVSKIYILQFPFIRCKNEYNLKKIKEKEKKKCQKYFLIFEKLLREFINEYLIPNNICLYDIKLGNLVFYQKKIYIIDFEKCIFNVPKDLYKLLFMKYKGVGSLRLAPFTCDGCEASEEEERNKVLHFNNSLYYHNHIEFSLKREKFKTTDNYLREIYDYQLLLLCYDFYKFFDNKEMIETYEKLAKTSFE